MKFYICRHCGNIIVKIKDVQVPISCCGETMEELQIQNIEASALKHLPTLKKQDGNIIIQVGELEHPMEKEHYIEWIAVQLEHGFMIEYLTPTKKPSVSFQTTEKVIAVYAYCTSHGLWKKEM